MAASRSSGKLSSSSGGMAAHGALVARVAQAAHRGGGEDDLAVADQRQQPVDRLGTAALAQLLGGAHALGERALVEREQVALPDALGLGGDDLGHGAGHVGGLERLDDGLPGAAGPGGRTGA